MRKFGDKLDVEDKERRGARNYSQGSVLNNEPFTIFGGAVYQGKALNPSLGNII